MLAHVNETSILQTSFIKDPSLLPLEDGTRERLASLVGTVGIERTMKAGERLTDMFLLSVK